MANNPFAVKRPIGQKTTSVATLARLNLPPQVLNLPLQLIQLALENESVLFVLGLHEPSMDLPGVEFQPLDLGD
jgi:hypothetical protein